jgi:hypothetical protein
MFDVWNVVRYLGTVAQRFRDLHLPACGTVHMFDVPDVVRYLKTCLEEKMNELRRGYGHGVGSSTSVWPWYPQPMLF